MIEVIPQTTALLERVYIQDITSTVLRLEIVTRPDPLGVIRVGKQTNKQMRKKHTNKHNVENDKSEVTRIR